MENRTGPASGFFEVDVAARHDVVRDGGPLLQAAGDIACGFVDIQRAEGDAACRHGIDGRRLCRHGRGREGQARLPQVVLGERKGKHGTNAEAAHGDPARGVE